MSTRKKTLKGALLLAGAVALTLPALPAIAAGGAPETATIAVHIGNVAPEGTIRLGLYTEAAYSDGDARAVASADVPAQAGETVVELQNIAPGTYAIETYQDLNNNGKFDTSLIGIPEEPYGFSRDARPHLHKPHFDSVKFTVAAGRNDQVLHLQNVKTLVATK